jgi:hypothetical protein
MEHIKMCLDYLLKTLQPQGINCEEDDNDDDKDDDDDEH